MGSRGGKDRQDESGRPMNYEHWRTRTTITLHDAPGDARGTRAKRVAKALRDVGFKANASFIEVVVIRRFATCYAADPITAQIHALDMVYRYWPKGEPLPASQVLARTTYVRSREDS